MIPSSFAAHIHEAVRCSLLPTWEFTSRWGAYLIRALWEGSLPHWRAPLWALAGLTNCHFQELNILSDPAPPISRRWGTVAPEHGTTRRQLFGVRMLLSVTRFTTCQDRRPDRHGSRRCQDIGVWYLSPHRNQQNSPQDDQIGSLKVCDAGSRRAARRLRVRGSCGSGKFFR